MLGNGKVMCHVSEEEVKRLERTADHYAKLADGLYAAGAFAMTLHDGDELSRERQRVDRVRIVLNRALMNAHDAQKKQQTQPQSDGCGTITESI
jgi:hypothetical protein